MEIDIRQLGQDIVLTLGQPRLTSEKVIAACDTLATKVRGGEYDDLLEELGRSGIAASSICEAVDMLCAESLYKKIETELGTDRDRIQPLGVLFHIGAGNMHGIAAYSIIEGLLCGNINIAKLSGQESGISVFILKELAAIEPLLEPYIYIFDFSHEETVQIRALAELSDAVVIWGGDEAVESLRSIIPARIKLIEWGHKISFAYITKAGMTAQNMMALSAHLAETKQRLCSSCQGIYLDSSDEMEIRSFCRTFLSYYEAAVEKTADCDLGWKARNTINKYLYRLDQPEDSGCVAEIFDGQGVNMIYICNPQLEYSLQEGNLWVKSLPRERIIETLRPGHGWLQTVGLLCEDTERNVLSQQLFRAGVTSIRGAGDMSAIYPGDAHDGEYPLRRYSRL